MDLFAHEFECLRVIFLEGLSEFVRQACAYADKLSSFLDEGCNLVTKRIFVDVWLEAFVPFKDILSHGCCVAPVVLGPGCTEGFPVFFDDSRVFQINNELSELGEEVHEVLAGLFNTEGNGGVFRAILLKLIHPCE